ncbi:hypothetical protein MMPV_010010 [Pyropia vietnamensis]
MANMAPGWARPPRGGELLRLERGVSQREFSLPAHAAARARLYEELTLHGRARLAACQGGGAGRWLAALPLPGPGGAAFSGDAMRVAVRLWLGVAPRSAPPGHRCRCGAEVDAEGRHFLGPCLALKRRATHLHTTIVKQSAVWRDVVVEPELYPGAPESLRPDLRATRVTSGRRTWADVSLASPLEARELARVAAAPLAPLAAAKRERGKAAKYEAALPAATPPSEFAPLVWETFGRVGPATAAFLRSALGGPGGTSARSALLPPATALPPIYFLGSMGGDGARIEPIARAVAAVLDVAVTTTTTMTTMDRAELLIQGGDATPMEGVVASGREGAGGSTRAESGRSGVCGVPGGVPGAPQEAPGDASRAGAVPPAAVAFPPPLPPPTPPRRGWRLAAGCWLGRRPPPPSPPRRVARAPVPPDAAAPSAGGAAGVVGASAAARGGAPRGVSRAGAPAPPPLTGDAAGVPALPRAPAARPAATWAAVAARPAPAPAVARPARSPAASAPRAPASGPLAADRAHAAAAELLGAAGGHERRVALETILVSGISRDVRAHRLRHLIADLTGVSISKFLDIDRFGSVAAVTLRAAAAAEFRAALRAAPTSTVLTVVEGADAWSAALLGPRRRAQLGPAAAAAAAADLCRRRLTAKLRQLAGRVGLPPHLRASLAAHVAGELAAHPAAGAATTAAAAAPAGAANTATPPAQPAPADAALAALPPTCAAPPSRRADPPPFPRPCACPQPGDARRCSRGATLPRRGAPLGERCASRCRRGPP